MKNKITKLFLALLALASFNNVNAQEQEQTMPEYVRKATNIEFLLNFSKEKSQEFERRYQKAVEIAEQKGMPIGGSTDGNAFSLVNYEDETGALIYNTTFNNSPTASSLKTANAKDMHTDGINGTGMNVGVWDGGVLTINHLGFMTAGVNRYSVKDTGNNFQGNNQDGREHGPHVAGTVAAGNFGSGLGWGFAWGAKVFAYNWIQDLSEMATAAASTTAPIYTSNHSYGLNTANYFGSGGSVNIFGLYNSDARDYDLLANNAPYYTIVFAAGNDRDANYNPAKNKKDLLSQAGVSKNVVVVAATYGTENYTGITGTASVSGSNPFIAPFSNYGPTNDFRIKPDIAAKGMNVTSVGITGNQATDVMSGTSMAAPAVTGVLTMWQGYHNDLFGRYMKSATVRALMAHTAREAGPAAGPDFMFGWGLIDAGKGKLVMDAVKDSLAVMEELSLTQGDTYEYVFPYDGFEDLVVTMAWNDPAGTADTTGDVNLKKLVNDLDITLTNLTTGKVFYPWALDKKWSILPTSSNIAVRDARNERDNIEKIEFLTSADKIAGDYKITINHTGTLQGGSQDYSLIVSGASKLILSVDDIILNDLNIYPNPTTSVLNIAGDLGILANASFKVYDMLGKEVKSQNLTFSSDNTSIDVSTLKEGVYMLVISKDGAKKSYKFIKK